MKPLPHLAEPEAHHPLDFSVGYLLRVTHRCFAQDLQRHLAPYDVPMGMWYFLRALWQENGLTQRELSRRVGSMEPTTVEQLKNMERRGFIERRRSTDDRRKIHVSLTPEGRALVRGLLPFAEAVNAKALEGLSEGEIGFLRLVLSRMKKQFEAREAATPATTKPRARAPLRPAVGSLDRARRGAV